VVDAACVRLKLCVGLGVEIADVLTQLLHLLLLDHEVFPIEHLDLRLVLPLLQLGEQVAHLFKDPIFLHDYVIFFLRKLRPVLARLQNATQGAVRIH